MLLPKVPEAVAEDDDQVGRLLPHKRQPVPTAVALCLNRNGDVRGVAQTSYRGHQTYRVFLSQ